MIDYAPRMVLLRTVSGEYAAVDRFSVVLVRSVGDLCDVTLDMKSGPMVISVRGPIGKVLDLFDEQGTLT